MGKGDQHVYYTSSRLALGQLGQHTDRLVCGDKTRSLQPALAVMPPLPASVSSGEMSCAWEQDKRAAAQLCWWWGAVGLVGWLWFPQHISKPLCETREVMFAPLTQLAINWPKKLVISCPSGVTLLREEHVGEHEKNTIQQLNALQAFIISDYDCLLALRKVR